MKIVTLANSPHLSGLVGLATEISDGRVRIMLDDVYGRRVRVKLCNVEYPAVCPCGAQVSSSAGCYCSPLHLVDEVCSGGWERELERGLGFELEKGALPARARLAAHDFELG